MSQIIFYVNFLCFPCPLRDFLATVSEGVRGNFQIFLNRISFVVYVILGNIKRNFSK